MIKKVILFYNIRRQLVLSYIVSIILTIFFLKSSFIIIDLLIILKVVIFQNMVLKIENSVPVSNRFLRIYEVHLKRILQFRNITASVFFFTIFLIDFFILFSFDQINNALVYGLMVLVFTLNLFIVSYLFLLVNWWNGSLFSFIPFFQNLLCVLIQIALYLILHLLSKDSLTEVLFIFLFFQFSLVLFLHQSISSFKAFKND